MRSESLSVCEQPPKMPHLKEYDVINNNSEVERIPFPYKIEKIDPIINEQLLKDFTGK